MTECGITTNSTVVYKKITLVAKFYRQLFLFYTDDIELSLKCSDTVGYNNNKIRQFITRRNTAKPLQVRELTAVTISVSVSCLPVSGSAAEQVSLETTLKQLQQMKIPDLFWQPVPWQWCSHCERTFSEICLSLDNNEVTTCGRS